RLGQILELGWRRQLVLREKILVVVDIDIAIIDRQQRVGRVELEAIRDARQRRRGIRIEDAGLERAAQESVVHAEEDIGQRATLAQNGLVERRPSIAGFEHLNSY